MIDVVVPFVGGDEALAGLTRDLSRLELHPGDTVTIVDNRPQPGAVTSSFPQQRILTAPERQSSYYARNRGVAEGSAEWLLFVDADVEVPADLLDCYFARPAAESAGVLAGEIFDIEVGGESIVGRFLTERASMSQANTLRGKWSYAQTANCAVRRKAFEAVGGFADDIRSGGDADLCFRLRAAGWVLEVREDAAVAHRARSTVRALVKQRARHGSGCAWLNRAYPGSFPAHSWPGLLKWTVIGVARAFASLVRGDRAAAAQSVLDPISSWALQLGRLGSNRAGGDR